MKISSRKEFSNSPLSISKISKRGKKKTFLEKKEPVRARSRKISSRATQPEQKVDQKLKLFLFFLIPYFHFYLYSDFLLPNKIERACFRTIWGVISPLNRLIDGAFLRSTCQRANLKEILLFIGHSSLLLPKNNTMV